MRLVGNYHNNYIQLNRKKESQSSKDHAGKPTNTIKFGELISDIEERNISTQHNSFVVCICYIKILNKCQTHQHQIIVKLL